MSNMIIDTHVHVWDLSRAAYPWLERDKTILNNNWHIEQLEKERREAGITAGLLVQASGTIEDTDVMLETAYQTEWISGVVAWLPLMDTRATQRVLEERFLKEKYFKGVRHQVHDERDPAWLLQPQVIESLKALALHDIPFDVVAVLPGHMETALKVAEKIPGLRMVFDHLGQPPISTKEKFGRWGELLKEAADHKNFWAKISGLGTASGNFQHRKTGEIKPYVAFALEHFGTDRCFCGGDWPVSLLANSYTGTWTMYKEVLNELLAEKDKEKVFYTNAKECYHL